MDASHPLWVSDWKESKGEATIQRHCTGISTSASSVPVPGHVEGEDKEVDVVLYCSWFCPFAQRAWIAVEELGINYEYVECNPYKVDPREPGGYTKQSLSLPDKQKLMPQFMKTSPRGLVPAITDVQHNKADVWESSVVMEYLDTTYGHSTLYTKSPHIQALLRIYVDHCTARIQKSYYTFLMETNPQAQTTAKNEFFHECRVLACAMAPTGTGTSASESSSNLSTPTPDKILQETMRVLQKDTGNKGMHIQRVDVQSLSQISQRAFQQETGKDNLIQPGPFFLGQHFSAVDVALAPFWQRILWVGAHYRDLKLPSDAAFERLDTWWQAVSQRPGVANTLVCKERLVSSYRQYAHNIATSDFAKGMQSSLRGESTTTTTTTTTTTRPRSNIPKEATH
ncbi:Glutathione S-transferase, N-terminal domain [Seminavis robusta]|uniref:Glutathione S-transferase, N-terminal domain n=1 Tax=Seminavis robusta TaxID=568900 RepID=A0A9N8DV74_9STRA|nr:Glutathione S-transferase, N-terminal domain [Seminavis robusta]|eukprot:Sro270_g104280.1 Glutathione S-transferase, N-terminal domain (397) ;mRNA; f:50062-51252